MAAVTDSFDFEELGIAELLKRYRLKVPRYQRDYAWTDTEVTAFLQDITSAQQEDEPNYFLGTIVTIKRGATDLEVVDGQQRLATATLLLAAMRHLYGSKKQNLHTLLTGFLFSINSKTLSEENQLSLNLADTEVFKSLVIDGVVGSGFVKTRESHTLLDSAYKLSLSHLRKIVSTVSEVDQAKPLQLLIEFLELRASTILLKVTNDTSAFKMFETLNDRGLEVSQADLIKNYVFSESGENLDQIQQHWTSIKSTLENVEGESNAINFIWHALITLEGFVEKKKIFERVKKTIKGKNTSLNTLASWDKLAKYYIGLFNPLSPIWADNQVVIRKQIEVLNLLDIQPFRPILMSSALQMSKIEIAKVFTRMISVGVRLLIASRTTTQSVAKALAEAANKIWTKEIIDSKALIEFLAASIPNDEQFRSNFEIATVSSTKLARYYLRTLEQAAKNAKEPWEIPNDDPAEINLEHVLPNNPGVNWPSFTADQVSANVKRIGNLMLMQASKNAKLGNAKFSDKKAELKQSPFKTTFMINDYDDWTPETLALRQKELAKIALKAWPLKG